MACASQGAPQHCAEYNRDDDGVLSALFRVSTCPFPCQSPLCHYIPLALSLLFILFGSLFSSPLYIYLAYTHTHTHTDASFFLILHTKNPRRARGNLLFLSPLSCAPRLCIFNVSIVFPYILTLLISLHLGGSCVYIVCMEPLIISLQKRIIRPLQKKKKKKLR